MLGEYLGGFGLEVDAAGNKPNRRGDSFAVGTKTDAIITQNFLDETMHSIVQEKMKYDMLFLALECSAARVVSARTTNYIMKIAFTVKKANFLVDILEISLG